MSNFLVYEQSGAVVTLTMNAPEVRNALTGNAAVDEFVNAVERINADPSVRVMILTGAGTVFSSGGNVKDMKRFTTDAVTPAEIGQWYRTGIQRLPLALQKLEVPSIAAVNGPAIGAGNDLACMCDMRIASTNASFAESFIRVGLIPGDGGAWLLPRVVGLSKAMEMSFTGDAVKADEALAIGLVSRVVAPEALMDEARALAARIAAQPGADAAPDQAAAARRPASEAGFAARAVGGAAGDRAQDPGACRGGECLHRKARAEVRRRVSALQRAPVRGGVGRSSGPLTRSISRRYSSRACSASIWRRSLQQGLQAHFEFFGQRHRRRVLGLGRVHGWQSAVC